MAAVFTSLTADVAIIGGGLSGSLVATQLLRLATGPIRVAVVDPHPPIGRGVAYGTDCVEHLLNVPAARMGAFAEAQDHFYKWVAARVGRVGFPV